MVKRATAGALAYQRVLSISHPAGPGDRLTGLRSTAAERRLGSEALGPGPGDRLTGLRSTDCQKRHGRIGADRGSRIAGASTGGETTGAQRWLATTPSPPCERYRREPPSHAETFSFGDRGTRPPPRLPDG